jgi:hypothetical protein
MIRAGRHPGSTRKDTSMDWNTIQQFIRIVLQFGAGLLVSRGILTADMAAQAVGAVLSLGGIAWWVVWNRKAVEAK